VNDSRDTDEKATHRGWVDAGLDVLIFGLLVLAAGLLLSIAL
jgi:hypothetical protein